MKIPNYVKDTIGELNFVRGMDYDSQPGYTIRVHKTSDYMTIDVFRKRIDKVIDWARRHQAEAYINWFPERTHYTEQFAVITITDPVMMALEDALKAV